MTWSHDQVIEVYKIMEIIVEDISSYIEDVRMHTNALAIIRDVCRARPNGFQFMPKYKAGRWDGYISLMHSFSRFPTGLLRPVAERLQDYGFHLTFTVKSVYKEYDQPGVSDLIGIELRDYQIEAIRELLEHKRGIAKMATNSGKTEVMAGIIRCLRFPKTLVLLHRKELLYQTAKRFEERLGVSHVGVIGDGKWDPDVITIAMIQTLSSKLSMGFPIRGSELDGVELLMVDECHHLSSDTALDVANRISGGYRYGFSGTPLKTDVLADLKLMSITGRVLVDVSNSYLIKEGFSAVPIVHIQTVASEDGYELSYQLAYKSLIVDYDVRNKMIIDTIHGLQGITLVLVNHIGHGRKLLEMLPEAVFVHGSDPIEYRNSVLDSMRASSSGVFIASPIFDEGVDVPSIDNVVLAGGGKSYVKLLQRIGRGLRRKDGNNVLNVYDFIDDTNKYLLRHSEARINTYVREGFETRLV